MCNVERMERNVSVRKIKIDKCNAMQHQIYINAKECKIISTKMYKLLYPNTNWHLKA